MFAILVCTSHTFNYKHDCLHVNKKNKNIAFENQIF